MYLAVDQEREYFRVRPWDYVGVARCLGGRGERTQTRTEFREALHRAHASRDFYLLEAVVPEDDASPTLKRLGKEYGGKIRMASGK